MLLGVYLFEQSYLTIVTITFSALIVSEYLLILTEVIRNFFWQHICNVIKNSNQVYKVTKVMIVSIILSLLTYLASCYFLSSLIDVSAINVEFAWRILLLTFVCWAPLWIFRKIRERVSPTDNEIIMKSARNAVPIAEAPNRTGGKLRLTLS